MHRLRGLRAGVSGHGDLPRGGRPGQPQAVRADQSGRVQGREPARPPQALAESTRMPPRSVEAQTRISESDRPRAIRAITLDYWNTLIDDRGEEGPRKTFRYEAIRTLFAAYDCELSHFELHGIYS